MLGTIGHENWAAHRQLLLLGGEQFDPVALGREISGNDNYFGMRITQMAPVSESLPPKYYRGRERDVSCRSEELVRVFEQRLNAARMAHDYVRSFHRLIERKKEEASEAA